ncbi:MAG: acetate/propionate family kinase, partial [Hyphomicrobiaceae bacterium]
CFDTAFHRDHPWIADTYALPRRFYDAGVRRYGFHGLSYAYVTGVLRAAAPEVATGRLVIAHLGNGASACALQGGRSIYSSMGFSALDGLPMGTRCGQIDPGVLLYLIDSEGLGSRQIADVLYKQSGLKGLSGLSNDVRELEAAGTREAAEALDYFAFHVRREIAAMAGVLGGLDALVFCGGIGENARAVRGRICETLGWLGIEIDAARNDLDPSPGGALDIGAGLTRVLVVPTDEERVIARAVVGALHGTAPVG